MEKIKNFIFGDTAILRVLGIVWLSVSSITFLAGLIINKEFDWVFLVTFIVVWFFIRLFITISSELFIKLVYGTGHAELQVFDNNRDLSLFNDYDNISDLETFLKGLKKLEILSNGYLVVINKMERFVFMVALLLMLIPMPYIGIAFANKEYTDLINWLAVLALGMAIYQSTESLGKEKLRQRITLISEKIEAEKKVVEEQKQQRIVNNIESMLQKLSKISNHMDRIDRKLDR
ncbi:hypothetical protein ACFFHF_17075 [Robertmurraya beringensis]|uniref:Reticulon-like protein n=1 Tax=Robertmurraya beringensis TaxID=641660 RepID=A0ABV6KUB0_9BACI